MKDLLAVINEDLQLNLTKIYTISGVASDDLADYATENEQFVGQFYSGDKNVYFVVTENSPTQFYEI